MKPRQAGFLVAVIMTLLLALAGVSAAQPVTLSITNTTLPNPATVGRNLTYGMNVINSGQDTATGVVVTDTLPPGVTLISAVFGFQDRMPRTPCAGTTTITCDIGRLGVGRLEGAGVFITVRPQTTGLLSNTATVTANGADAQSATVETPVEAQVPAAIVLDPALSVSTVVSGLSQPTSMVSLAPMTSWCSRRGPAG